MKKFLAWMFKPPAPEVSNVVSVSIRRRRPDGKIVKFTLTGDNASKWGYWINRGVCGYDALKELIESKAWKVELEKDQEKEMP